jgi:hypothetical protein
MKFLSWIAGIGFTLSFVFIAFAFGTAGIGATFSGDTPALKTTGRLEWAWDGGDRIGIGVPATVHYQSGGTPRVIVRGPADLLQRVRFENGNLDLQQDFFGDFGGRGESLDVTLTGMTLHRVGLSGHVVMDMGEIHQDSLQISISGHGTVDASGNADDLSLNISGSGAYHLAKLAAHSVRVGISGSGHVDTSSPASAQVSISGSGDVHFIAMPKDISSHISGSGRISDDNGQVIDSHRHIENS